MSIEFILPDLGENIDKGDVVGIFISVGDSVSKEQSILEIETDKAVIEVPSSVAGIVSEILIKEGDSISPGQAIFSYDPSAASQPEPTPVQTESAPKTETPAPPKPAPIAPIKSTPIVEKSAPPKAKASHSKVAAAPSVRRIAREIGIDIAEIAGSGPAGRVTMQDVKNFSRQKHATAAQLKIDAENAIAAGAGFTERPLPDFSKWGDIDRQAMSKVRRITAEHLSYAWHAPHVTQFDKADITNLEQMRKRYAPKASAAGGKLTITAILLKFVASALKVFPQFNASIDMGNQEIVFKKYYNIGVAVDTPRGLLVPVINNVDQKSIIELSVALAEMSERARNRKTTLDELQGGTFSVTNLGGIGGTAFTPIINAPEVAILGVSRGRIEPVFDKESGQFEPKMLLPLSLSYDHRIIDGADAAKFVRWLVEALENPFLSVLEG